MGGFFMNREPVIITNLTRAHIPAVIDLMMAQEMRQSRQNAAQMAVHSRHQIEAALTDQYNNDMRPVVALNRYGNVRGYAHPAIWELNENSILLSFLTARNGIVQKLTLPDPTDEYAGTTVNTLLDFLNACWQRAGTSGDLIRWPSTDYWAEPLFIKHGFRLDSICTFHPQQPFFSNRPMPSPLQRIRAARPEDEKSLISLFEQELRFHERYTPFVHSSPQVLEAFRRKLQHLWQGISLEDEAPLILVAEQGHEIVAMAENTLLEVGPYDEPGFTPPGHYWCIDNISVRADLQGQGIGRLLMQAIEDILTSLQLKLNGYVLWFNPDNPKAAHFWSSLGFQPLWTTYQRFREGAASK
jgi:GNAT superfamily N-acetyltransferase